MCMYDLRDVNINLRTKVHETKFSRAGIFFGIYILFRVFNPLLWHNPNILEFFLNFSLKSGKLSQ